MTRFSYLIYLTLLDEEESSRELQGRLLGTDVKGDIFEYLLTHLGQSALNGQFRTPRQIRTMMVEMIDPDLGDTVYDPACGTGGFLIDAVEHILAKYSTVPLEVPIYGEEWLEKRGQSLAEARTAIPTLQTYRKGPGEKIPDWRILERSIHGIDVSDQMMRIAMMNLVLHGIRKANIKRANTLSDMGGLSEDDLARRYKVILSNPLFAGVLPKESIRKDLPTNSKKSELLFLGVMMEALAPGGTCAVLPEGTVESRSWWTTVDALTEDFSLAAGRYKPQIAEAAPEGNPAQLIRETLALEREIVTGLEKLLIVEHEQGGKARAEYGEALMARLARDLVAGFGRGFSYQNLNRFRQFYLAFPSAEILSTPSRELESSIPQALSTAATASPTHSPSRQ